MARAARECSEQERETPRRNLTGLRLLESGRRTLKSPTAILPIRWASTLKSVVIEFLTFDVDPAERDEWLAEEERHWSRYLETRPGFGGQGDMGGRRRPGRVHAVIRWETQQAWDDVPRADVETVDAAMGDWCREATMRAFRVVRER